MLGKLYRYDMRAHRRFMLPMSLGIIISSCLAAAVLRLLIFLSGSDLSSPLVALGEVSGWIFVGLSVIVLIAFPTVAFVFILSYFYKNFFTDEGYLTFTLPVRTGALLTSKFLSSLTSGIVIVLITAVCAVVILFFGTANGELINSTVWDVVKEFFDLLIDEGGVSSIVVYGIFIIISGVFLITSSMLAITIGSVAVQKHKILAAIGFYYVINIIVSAVTSGFSFVFMLAMSGSLDASGISSDFNAFFDMSLLMNSIIYSGFIAAEYILCNYFIKQKLNLQ